MERWRSDPHRPLLAPLSLALTGILLLCGVSAFADESPTLRFARYGTSVTSLELAELRNLLPSRSVRVHEPYEAREVTFEALALDAILDEVYSPDWREQEEMLLLFSCRDGYQPTLPVQRVLRHRAWLAFDRRDEEGFSVLKFESGSVRRIELSPFYLIWENLSDPQMRIEGDYGWPYQVVQIDLIRAQDRFPRMTPPEDAPADVRAGFAAFRVHCSRCHTINGEGGLIGPELNGDPSLIENRGKDWLRRWIANPSEMRADTRMPRLNPAQPERKETIERIIGYLEAMSAAKKVAAGAS